MARADLVSPHHAGQGWIDERSTGLDERSIEADEHPNAPAGPPSRWIALTVAAAVVGAALLGLLVRVTLDGAAEPSALTRSFLRDLIAAAAWIPVGAGVVWLARRVPLRRARPVMPAVIHLSGVAAAAFSVNVLIAAGWWVTGLWPDPRVFHEMVLTGTIRHVHANALIYTILLLIALRAPARIARRDRSRPSRPDDVAGRRLPVPDGDRTLLVPLSRVDWIEAAGDYAAVHAGNRSYLLSERMHALEAQLRERGFARVHRSAIVNLASVTGLRSERAGNGTLVLKCGTEVPLSRRRKAEVRARLGVSRARGSPPAAPRGGADRRR